ncbi:MAG: HAMP domain-containing histidine kinase, partial [Solirubrobacterales bacterium]|nr:HAMP domain-containing histidine kinase [Solirubrobacterales bacterium]
MSLRRRLALLSAAAVAVTVIVASAVIYLLVRDSLRDNVDDELEAQAGQAAQRLGEFETEVLPGPLPGPPIGGPSIDDAPIGGPAPGGHPGDILAIPAPDPGGAPLQSQLIDGGEGMIARPGNDVTIPVSSEARGIARDGGDPSFDDVEADGTTLRVLTQPVEGGLAVQVATSLEDTEETLGTLVLILVLVSAGGIAAAAALGPVVARTALAPAGEVSDAAQEVARTRDLTRRIEVRGDDELGRLSSSFNEMMEALERSESSQRRLVADASHELRTPLAVLRTNIEILGRSGDMEAAERDRLVTDVTDELEEMTALVSDVVELAREPGTETLVMQDVALDELVLDAVARARRRFREVEFSERVEPALVHGDRQRLGRAISNLLDNAGKWSA